MPLLMGSPIGGYLRPRPPLTWLRRTPADHPEMPRRTPTDGFLPWQVFDRPTLDPAMGEAPPRTGSRQIPVTRHGLRNYRPTDPPVLSALWIPPWPRYPGWGANAQIPLRAPLIKRLRLDRDRLNEQPDERFGWTRPPRGIWLRQYIVNRRSINPYDFVVFCFTEIY